MAANVTVLMNIFLPPMRTYSFDLEILCHLFNVGFNAWKMYQILQ